MPTIPLVKQGGRRADGVRALVRLVGLASLALLVLSGLVGCSDLPRQKVGQRCGGEWGPCDKGLRCSFKKKRCYLPVDCKHLERRTKACLTELVAGYAPSLNKLPAAKRAQLLERIGHHLQSELVDHCKYDAAAYQKKHGSAPTLTKSYGQDPLGKKITACLKLQGCKPFAKCMLELARVKGAKQPTAGAKAVFPLTTPRPAPEEQPDGGVPADGGVSPDGGVPAGKDAMKDDKGAIKGGKAPMKTKAVPPMKTKAAVAPMPAARPRPAMPAARPRPARPVPRR